MAETKTNVRLTLTDARQLVLILRDPRVIELLSQDDRIFVLSLSGGIYYQVEMAEIRAHIKSGKNGYTHFMRTPCPNELGKSTSELDSTN